MADPFLMKGKIYSEHKHKLNFPVSAEVKYDEIRLHVKRFPATAAGPGFIPEHLEFLSYAGKPLCNLWAWADKLLTCMQQHDLHHLDMGVLVNGNFNDSYRWCRSSTGIPGEKLDKATGRVAPALHVDMVNFYLFDLPDSPLPYRTRAALRQDMVCAMWDAGLPVFAPSFDVAHSEAELDTIFLQVREAGLEGLMVKSLDHVYQPGKRIDGWLKMKPEDTADGIITDVLRATSIHGEPLDRVGSVYVSLPDGSNACPAGIPHELGRLMWMYPERYIGQWVEFKYMERDRAGGYRHPSLVRLREPK